MGVFRCGDPGVEVELADRALAHLKLAITVKLRRHEPFLLRLPTPPNVVPWEVWIRPAPMSFITTTSGPMAINGRWVDALVKYTDEHGVMDLLTEKEAALYLAGIDMPTDRRRGVHVVKHPKITSAVRRRARR